MSLAGRLGLPEAVQTALLLVALALALAPYFAGMSIAGLQVPAIDRARRRRMRIAGPAILLGSLALVVPLSLFQPSPTILRLIAVDVTDSGNIDAVVANDGSSAALLTAVELEVLGERGISARPELLPGAAIQVPVDDLPPGGRRSSMIRLLVGPKSHERLVISPLTGRGLLLRLRIRSADGTALMADVDLIGPNHRLNTKPAARKTAAGMSWSNSVQRRSSAACVSLSARSGSPFWNNRL